MYKRAVISFACAAQCQPGGVVVDASGLETATRFCTVRVLESHLYHFRTSMTLNEGRVSAQLLGDISIWRTFCAVCM
jgi:hypothetical protein